MAEQDSILANRILRQFADHLLGGLVPEEQDFQVMRVIFRKLGGNWEAAYHGDVKQLTLLEKVVVGWGSNKQKESDA